MSASEVQKKSARGGEPVGALPPKRNYGWLKNIAIAATNDADAHYDALVDWGHIKFIKHY